MLPEELQSSVFKISNEEDFNQKTLEIFHYQYKMNEVYRELVNLLKRKPAGIEHFRQIPFLPVSFFKSHKIVSGEDRRVEKVFTSSSTTDNIPSAHHILDLALYKESFTRSFELFYGKPEQYRFLALLPGYLERQGSSLVHMLNHFIRATVHNGSGFYLHDMDKLYNEIESHSFEGTTILFGASYALLDFASTYSPRLVNGLVMETGGMKGRKKELIREELHDKLCEAFKVEMIHSEYGMTELLTQAYSGGHGIFRSPPWMKVLVRDINDPLDYLPAGQTGGINIIDLANLNSCSFLSTQDLGKLHDDGSFEILGRFDDSDMRGCNLLVV
jgi:hypothetical protein